jgi:hypothetical protein
MSLPSPITISQEAKLLKKALDEYAQGYGGTAEVVSNLKDLWANVHINSQSPRILILYAGETARGSFSQIEPWHRVDREWHIAVTKGRGWYTQRGDPLFNHEQTEKPLYDVVEEVRDLVRWMDTISEETPGPDFRKVEPMSYGNMALDGYLIKVTTANDIPSKLSI